MAWHAPVSVIDFRFHRFLFSRPHPCFDSTCSIHHVLSISVSTSFHPSLFLLIPLLMPLSGEFLRSCTQCIHPVSSVDYVVNPLLMDKFEARKAQFAHEGKPSKPLLAFCEPGRHTAPGQSIQDIIHGNFHLQEISPQITAHLRKYVPNHNRHHVVIGASFIASSAREPVLGGLQGGAIAQGINAKGKHVEVLLSLVLPGKCCEMKEHDAGGGRVTNGIRNKVREIRNAPLLPDVEALFGGRREEKEHKEEKKEKKEDKHVDGVGVGAGDVFDQYDSFMSEAANRLVVKDVDQILPCYILHLEVGPANNAAMPLYLGGQVNNVVDDMDYDYE